MAIQVRDVNGTPFSLEEMPLVATRREWLCSEVPDGGGLRVMLTDADCAAAKRMGTDVSEKVVASAVILAVEAALRRPLLQAAVGRDVHVRVDHLNEAATARR